MAIGIDSLLTMNIADLKAGILSEGHPVSEELISALERDPRLAGLGDMVVPPCLLVCRDQLDLSLFFRHASILSQEPVKLWNREPFCIVP